MLEQKNKQPFFSVLIPVFNGEAFVAECINSILTQSFVDFELLICDDASTDKTLEILEVFAKKDSRIRILKHETNQRALITRNDLIRAAKGKYCIFADADDKVLPSFFETAAETLKQKHYDIIQYSFQVNQDCSSNDKKMGLFKTGELYGEEILKSYLTREPLIFAPYAKTYERKLLLKAMPEDQNLFMADDIPLTIRAVFFADSYRSERKIVYHYNYGAGNCGTKNWSLEKIEKYIQSLSSVLSDTERFFEQNKCPEIYKKRVREIIQGLYTNLLFSGEISAESRPEAMIMILRTFGKEEQDVFLLNNQLPLSCMLKICLRFSAYFLKRNLHRLFGKTKRKI